MTTPVQAPATDWRGIQIVFALWFFVSLLWATFRPFVNTSGTNFVQMAGLAIFVVAVIVVARRAHLGWWTVLLVIAVPILGWAVKDLHFTLTRALGSHRVVTSLILVGLAASVVGLMWVGRKTRDIWQPVLDRLKAWGIRLGKRYEALPGLVRWIVIPFAAALLGQFLFGAFLPAAILVGISLAGAIAASRNQAPEIARRASTPVVPLTSDEALPFDPDP